MGYRRENDYNESDAVWGRASDLGRRNRTTRQYYLLFPIRAMRDKIATLAEVRKAGDKYGTNLEHTELYYFDCIECIE